MVRRLATIAFVLLGLAVGTGYAGAQTDTTLAPSGELLTPAPIALPTEMQMNALSPISLASSAPAPLGSTTATLAQPNPQPTDMMKAVQAAKALVGAGCTILSTSASGTASPNGQAVSSSGGIDAVLDQTTNPSNLLARSTTSGGTSLSQGAYQIASYLWGMALVFSLALWFIKHFRRDEGFLGMLNNIEAKVFGVGCSFLLLQYAAGEGAFANNGGPAIQILGTVVDNIALNLAQYVIAPTGSNTNVQTPITNAAYRISTPGDAFRAGTCFAWRTASGPKIAALASISTSSPTFQQDVLNVVDGLTAAASSTFVSPYEWIAGFLNIVPFAILAFQLFLVKWAAIVFGAVAIILLGFNVLEVTAPWAESYWKFLFGNLMSQFTIVFVAYFIAALFDAVQTREFLEITTAPTQSNILGGLFQAGTAPLTGLIDNIFISLFATGIALSTPSLTSILTSGSGGLSGGNILAVFGTAAAALAGGLGALTGATKALTAATKANRVAEGTEKAIEATSESSENANRFNNPKLAESDNDPEKTPTPEWNADAPDRPSPTFAEDDAGEPIEHGVDVEADADPQQPDPTTVEEAIEEPETTTVLADEGAEAIAAAEAGKAAPTVDAGKDAKPTPLQNLKAALGNVRAAGAQAMKATTTAEAAVALENLSTSLANFTAKTTELAASTAPASASGLGTSQPTKPIAEGQPTPPVAGSEAAASTNASTPTGASASTPTRPGAPRPSAGKAPTPQSAPKTPAARQARAVANTSNSLQACAQSLAAAAPYATGPAAAPFTSAAASLANAATMVATNGMTPQTAQAVRAAQADYAAATVSLAQTGNTPTPINNALHAANDGIEFSSDIVSAYADEAQAAEVDPGSPVDQPVPDAFAELMERTFTSFEASNTATVAALEQINKNAALQQKSMQQLIAAGPQGSSERRTASKEQAAQRKNFLQQLAVGIDTSADRARRLHNEHHHAGAAPRSSGIHH
jgi:hypothetical protein